MPSTNPVAKIADTALKVAGRAVGLVLGGVRGAARLAGQKSGSAGSSRDTATATTTQPETSAAARDEHEATPPGPVTAPPAEPDASIEEMAEAAVARELAEEPQPTEVADEPSPVPPLSEEPETVYSTSTEDADQSPRT